MRPDPLFLAWCREVLGSGTVLERHPSAGPSNTVIRLRSANRRTYIAKQHTGPAKYEREVHAYTHWAPSLGARAARLIATDREIRAVLLTAIPGYSFQPSGNPEVDAPVHHQAGALLRHLHSAQPAVPLPHFARWMRTRLSGWLDRSAQLLTREEQRLVRRYIDAVADLPTPQGVPCHLDYQPHNWLFDPASSLGVVDFEHARVDAAARDLVRLAFRHWRTAPALRYAFMDGYGRRLSAEEGILLTHCAALDAVTALTRAHETNNPALGAHGRTTLAALPRSP